MLKASCQTHLLSPLPLEKEVNLCGDCSIRLLETSRITRKGLVFCIQSGGGASIGLLTWQLQSCD